MPEIAYVQPGGELQRCEVPEGVSVMRGAVENGVPGIVAECGGACACATCQVVVDAAWTDRVPPPAAMELSMLDGEGEPGPARRLSCQIRVDAGLDGLRVHVPAAQY